MLRCLAILATLCGGPLLADVNKEAITERRPPKQLSAFGFFESLATMQPAKGVTPYEVTSPLFTDYADKSRYIYSPSPAAYQTEGVLEFPVGAALIKTFHYGANKVETRVLLHQEAGWKAWAYVWNEDGSDATLKIAGANVLVQTEAHGEIDYRVPNANQCKACHIGTDGKLRPIGPKIRNLNMATQLSGLVAAGVLAEVGNTPPQTPDYRDTSLALEPRARAYLDANCAHCHALGLPADTSGLYLNWEETRPIHLGVKKRPVAAGRGSGGLAFDIAPGAPELSIILFRLKSTDPGIMMPEIGRSTTHEEGVALIRAYIASLK